MLAPFHQPTGTSPVRPSSQRQRWRLSNSIIQASILINPIRHSSRLEAGDSQSSHQKLIHAGTSTLGSSCCIARGGGGPPPRLGSCCTALRSSSPDADPLLISTLESSLRAATAAAGASLRDGETASPPSPSPPPLVNEQSSGGPSAGDSEAARRGLASMAELANAWAQVSSRLTPGALVGTSNSVAAASVVDHDSCRDDEAATAISGAASGGSSTSDLNGVRSRSGAEDMEARDGVREGGGGAGSSRSIAPSSRSTAAGEEEEEEVAVVSPAAGRSGLIPSISSPPSSSSSSSSSPSQEHQLPNTNFMPSAVQRLHVHQHHHQQQQQQGSRQQHQGHQHPRQSPQEQQRPHFEAIITALKLALASLQRTPPRRDGRTPATRAVQLASTLADLCAAGLPLDASAMCAGVVVEAADLGALRADVIRMQLGPDVAVLVHDMLRVRQAPRRIELLDDEGASAVREWCLAFHDVRACVVEVVSWWDELQHMGGLPEFEQQTLALEALQIGAPLGHALGLGALSAVMEDMCLKVLFPQSYASTCAWLRGLLDPAEDALFVAQQRLLAALDADPDFGRLAGGLLVKARTKSLFSVMKKLLHLGDMARGGRRREELYDLLGMRAVVKPPDFLPPDEAEAAATKACYIVQDVACKLWRPIPSRSKDYIVAPKPNGYQSIHLTLELGQLDVSYDAYGSSSTTTADDNEFMQRPSSSSSPSALSSPSSSSTKLPALSSFELMPFTPLSSSATSSRDWDPTPYISTRTTPESQHANESLGNQSSRADGSANVTTNADTATGVTAALGCVHSDSVGLSPSDSSYGRDASAKSETSTESSSSSAAEAAAAGGPLCMELQIRTAAMDVAAERGDAAHTVYKGGLDARTARQLQAWTQELQKRLSEQPRGRLLLRAAAATTLSTGAEAQAAAERRRKRRERRAAAAAAAAALAAAAPLPPPHGAGRETDSVIGSAATPTLIRKPSEDSSPLPGPLQEMIVQNESAGVARVRRPKPDGDATAKLLPPPTRRRPSIIAAAEAATAADAASSIHSSQVVTAPSPSLTAPAVATVAHVNDGHASVPRGATGPDTVDTPVSESSLPSCSAGDTIGVSATIFASTSPSQSLGKRISDPDGPQPDVTFASSAAGPAESLDATAFGISSPWSVSECSSSLMPLGAASEVNGPSSPSLAPLLSPPPPAHHVAGMPTEEDLRLQAELQQQQQQEQQQQQLPPAQLTEQQRLMLFSSLGSIDEVEDIPLVIGLGQRDAAAAAEQLFRHLDVNGDGRLSLGEVRQALMDLAAPASERNAAALLAALDRNGDGGVSMEEFVEGLGQAQQQQQEEQQGQHQQHRERDALGRGPPTDISLHRQQATPPQPPPPQQQQQRGTWQPWQHRT